jgi:hypothetical protein
VNRNDRHEVVTAPGFATRESEKAFTHEVTSRGLPAPGYLTFICSSNLNAPMRVFQRVLKCPLCLTFHPLRKDVTA